MRIFTPYGAIYHQLIAEQTDFRVVHDEHRLVFADLRFAGRLQRAVVHVRRGRFAREVNEVRVPVAFAAMVRAVPGAFVTSGQMSLLPWNMA